ncbi:hypothetical protein V8H18_04920 [Lautropia mirabilis]
MAARLNIQRTGDGGVEQLQLKPGNNKLRVVPGAPSTCRIRTVSRSIRPSFACCRWTTT